MRIGITAGVNIFHTGGHFWGAFIDGFFYFLVSKNLSY